MIALEAVLTMKKPMKNNINDRLFYDAYAYFKHQISTDTLNSWRFILSKSKGRIRTYQEKVNIMNEHSHFPNKVNFEK